MTEAEKEELAVRNRRAEGTPCTEESFLAWKTKFENEIAQEVEMEKAASSDKKRKNKETRAKKKQTIRTIPRVGNDSIRPSRRNASLPGLRGPSCERSQAERS